VRKTDGQIDYVEFPGPQIPRVKEFYDRAFGWKFTDYGPDYVAFEDGRAGGGFTTQPDLPTALVILYAADLEAAEKRVKEAGGTITKPIFSFPGGRRFHFKDPVGNELAVWSDKEPGS
jgi:predicted enzyme related to lactoylglutathione lyase